MSNMIHAMVPLLLHPQTLANKMLICSISSDFTRDTYLSTEWEQNCMSPTIGHGVPWDLVDVF
jgi:hypothetical protein